jgi:SOS-response transcriptional repressor LexA
MLVNQVKSAARCGLHSNANNRGMADKKLSKETIAGEAAALKTRFDAHRPKLSQERFGLDYEIGTQGMVWQYLNGNRPLNLSVALKFSRGLGIAVGTFSPRLASELAAAGLGRGNDLQVSEPLGITAMQVPVVGTARGGHDAYYLEIEYPTGHGDGYVSYPAKRSNAYALRVRGDSMRPRIKPGEYVIVEPDIPVKPGDEVIVRTKSGKSMVKVLHSQRSGFVELLSLNDDHKPMTIDVNEIEFIHHVTGIAKEPLYDKSE